MKRLTTRIVLALLLLLAAAFLLRREARQEKPDPPPAPPPTVVEAPLPPPDPPAPAKIVVREPDVPRRTAPKEREPRTGPVPGWQALKSGSLKGVVKLNGVPHPEDVIDSERRVRWAFVYLSAGVPSLPPELMAPVLINQDGCTFDPHVLGIRVGQELDVFAKDQLFHKVRFVGSENRDLKFDQVQKRTFRRSEIMVKLACDQHPRTSAWIGVVDHPYFAVTTAAGGYGIDDIPPGRYLVKIWHERWAAEQQLVEIPVAANVSLNWVLAARKM